VEKSKKASREGRPKNEKEMGKENACYGKMSHETKTLKTESKNYGGKTF